MVRAPEIDRLHLSTLIQQVLSVIAERGGSRADDLHRTLVLQGGFPNVDQPTLIHVLRSMGAADLIEQAPDGLLITGLRGEKIVRNHDFYVAFIVQEEYRVNHAGHHVGNIAFVPEFEEGSSSFLRVAGGRSSTSITNERRSRSSLPRVAEFPVFTQSQAGHSPACPAEDEGFAGTTRSAGFLDMKAREMLLQARSTARDSGFLRAPIFQDGADAIWFTWTGLASRERFRLWRILRRPQSDDERIALVFEKTTVAKVKKSTAAF